MVGFLTWIFFGILYLILKPFSFLYTVVIEWKSAKGYWLRSGLALDRYINYDCYGLLNFLFLRKFTSYKFGRFDDTMSYVLGIAQTSNDLTWLGWLIVYLLWPIAPFRYWSFGHCQWSVLKKNNPIK